MEREGETATRRKGRAEGVPHGLTVLDAAADAAAAAATTSTNHTFKPIIDAFVCAIVANAVGAVAWCSC